MTRMARNMRLLVPFVTFVVLFEAASGVTAGKFQIAADAGAGLALDVDVRRQRQAHTRVPGPRASA